MTPLLLGIFVASLAGSLHCAGMCGALATVSCAGCKAARQSIAAMATYHATRGAAYAAAGFIAGAVGAVLDLGGEMLGVQRVVGVVAGFAVILAGVALIMRHGGFSLRAQTPPSVERMLARGHRAAMRVTPIPRAAAIGALSVLLPCGWLWAFLAVAAGTGSAVMGALAMVAFWAGSVPILAAVGLSAGRASSMARGHIGAVMGVAMIAIGLHTTLLSGARSEAIAALHPHAVAAAEVQLRAAIDEVPACCREAEREP